ncbi:MAG: hypothetical protein HYZ72_01545 [Deltaproteobacteria bacterium]|nr:hypothetical protein [Deltaproteobacteria bacterium]
MPSTTVGSFALVLHAHQPFVLGHDRWPHGSDWLCEAVVESYLPLLRILRDLVERGVSPRLTLSFSPVLCEQLASRLFQQELHVFLDTRLRTCAETGTHFRHTQQDDLAALTDYWARFYHETLDLLHSLDGDVLGAFRRLMEQGEIELITSAATHGYVPLLGSEESVALQLRLAVLAHEAHFGRRPRGVWLPECAYRPCYYWIPPVGPSRQERRALRRGLEGFLAEYGLEFFFADSHLILGGRPLPPYDDYFPHLARLREAGREEWPQRAGASPYKIYRVSSSGEGGERRRSAPRNMHVISLPLWLVHCDATRLRAHPAWSVHPTMPNSSVTGGMKGRNGWASSTPSWPGRESKR